MKRLPTPVLVLAGVLDVSTAGAKGVTLPLCPSESAGDDDELARLVTDTTGSAVTYGGVLYKEGGAVRLVEGLNAAISFSCMFRGLHNHDSSVLMSIGSG